MAHFRSSTSDNITHMKLLKILSRTLNAALLLCLGMYFFSHSKTSRLPTPEDLLADVFSEPTQKNTRAHEFSFTYRHTDYDVTPVATYDISGIIVSHNDISAWWDVYHTKDSVDIKDLCLIWGPHLENGGYTQASFHNESVSCHVTFDRDSGFEMQGLSNNHLLSDDEHVRDTIHEMKVGDQVHLSGYLVNYCPSDNPQLLRKSSLTRTDTAGGACEVMYVEDAEILKKFDRTWHSLHRMSSSLLLPLILLKILSFLVFPHIEMKLRYG